MPLDASILTITNKSLVPLVDCLDALLMSVNLAPSSTILQGTILGQVTSSANDVQTMTESGTPGSGTFKIAVTIGGVTQTTGTIAYDATGATVQTALRALSIVGPNVTVTGSASGPYVATFNNNLAGQPIPAMVMTSIAFNQGTIANVHTTTGRSAGTYAPYASGNSDGTQIPKCIAKYDCVTDAAGRITLGGQVGSEWGQTDVSVACYFSGTFKCEDLVGLDANAILSTVWFGVRLLNGTVSAGILRVA